jgi:hypothetical protein
MSAAVIALLSAAAMLLPDLSPRATAQSAPTYVNAVDLDIVPEHREQFLAAIKENGAATVKEPGCRDHRQHGRQARGAGDVAGGVEFQGPLRGRLFPCCGWSALPPITRAARRLVEIIRIRTRCPWLAGGHFGGTKPMRESSMLPMRCPIIASCDSTV